MSDNKSKFTNWIGLVPGRGKGIIVLAVMIIAAFSFGMLISSAGHHQVAEAETAHAQNADAHKDEATMWTCSMHPQIKLSKPGKCPICFMDLIPLEQGAGDELGPRQLRMSESAKEIAQIQTSPVTRAFAQTEVRMNGKIDYDETRVSYITAWVPGRLDKMYADYTGISVKKGDHMVHMYSPELISAQEELVQAKKAVKKLNNGSSVLKSTAELTLQSARDKLRLYGLSKEQIDEIEQSGKVTEQVMLKSPVSGVVVEKAAKEGMYVQTGTRIYTIADLSKLWVLFDAYETDLPWLREGQQVTFTSASFPGREFKGKITFIDPIIDKNTRTARVRALVDNKSGALKPDMYVSGIVKSLLDSKGDVVDGKMAESSSRQPLLIPASAALLTGKRAVVYVELPSDDGPLFEGREVELGPRAGDFYVVKSGLSDGDNVVTNGAFKLDSELQIHAKPSMMFVDAEGENTEPNPAPIKRPSANVQTADAKSETVSEDQQAVSALTPVYKSYFELQMALASDDLKKATESYAELKKRLSNVDMELFKGEAHTTWMKLSKSMTKFAEEGIKASDIEGSRKAFLGFSKNIIDLHDTFGHADAEDFYLTFCPMANNNKGAYWLQTVDTVYNSFYGAAMLRCGEIKQKLEPISEKVN
jgi:Cu(I)/Ag(I) efflux system membrane fusion protein